VEVSRAAQFERLLQRFPKPSCSPLARPRRLSASA